jgi:hypothetical protein
MTKSRSVFINTVDVETAYSSEADFVTGKIQYWASNSLLVGVATQIIFGIHTSRKKSHYFMYHVNRTVATLLTASETQPALAVSDT